MTLTFSASKIKTFIECRNRYYWRYIKRLPDTMSLYAILGTSFHKAVERFYTSTDNPYEVYEQTWHRERKVAKLPHDNKLYYDGMDMLDRYPGDNPDRVPTLSEQYFSLSFPNNEAPICQMNGVIDQYYEKKRMVWDLKTAKRKPTVKQLNNDPQFILYSWASERLFGCTPTIVWYHARTADELVADVAGPEKLQSVIDTIQEMIRFHENPQPDIVERTCAFCPYVTQCRGEGG